MSHRGGDDYDTNILGRATTKAVKHKRRYCKVPGCPRIVKSQGLCQRHGAKPKLCKVPGCTRQAQGNFDRMCKSHFKMLNSVTKDASVKEEARAPVGNSVYDTVLPETLGWKPTKMCSQMPLLQYLEMGMNKSSGWHRNEERLARGLPPIYDTNQPLDAWERELIWTEILLLSGVAESYESFAKAWGQEDNFHVLLTQFICDQQSPSCALRREQTGSEAAEGTEDENLATGMLELNPDFDFEGLEEELDILSSSEDEGDSSDSNEQEDSDLHVSSTSQAA